MRGRPIAQFLGLVALAWACLGADADPTRNALPPRAPRFDPPADGVLFADDFHSGTLERWKPDQAGVWSIRHGALFADLPDGMQERSIIYAGDPGWTDYALDLDVCAIRGVDKGVVVRVEGQSGIGVDLRGPGYHDVLLHRREWPLGRANVVNANAVWHHLRIEALGHRYRVFVNGELEIDRVDKRRSRPSGSIALAAYTGGTGECTIYFDNVVVSRLEAGRAEAVGR